MTHEALGSAFSLDVDEPLSAPIEQAIEPLRVGASLAQDSPALVRVSAKGDGWAISWGDEIVQAQSAGAAMARTLELINRHAAAGLSNAVPLHAAAVRLSGTRTVAMAGRSGSGKSTLGAAAMLAGHPFVAEEIAAVEPDTLRVRAFHRPIGLRRGGAKAIGVDYPEDDVYSDVYPWPIPMASRAHGGDLVGVALVTRQTQPPGVTELRPAAALVQLIEHCVVPNDDRVVVVFRHLEALVRRVPVVSLSYREPHDGVEMLRELDERWT